MNTGYLKTKIENHKKYHHFSMAEKITEYLRKNHPGIDVESPCFWEGGRYIAVFVTLVPNAVRMIIQLTDSGQDQHVYNLLPISRGKKARDQFTQYMQEKHPKITLRKRNSYAKLPAWDANRFTVKNEDLSAISKNVIAACDFFKLK